MVLRLLTVFRGTLHHHGRDLLRRAGRSKRTMVQSAMPANDGLRLPDSTLVGGHFDEYNGDDNRGHDNDGSSVPDVSHVH